MRRMRVNIVRQFLIKPSKPTPPHLRTHNISLVDELNPTMNIMRILFFPHSELKKDYSFLEHSLAQVLPHFYPVAGRYNKQTHRVDCNDEGAEFSVARVFGRQLDQLIGAEPEQLDHLLPLDICESDEPTDPMLAVWVNVFPCGGLAIGICVSHRIFDNSSLGVFLAAWARAASSGGEDVAILPYFDSNSNAHFPSENMPGLQLSWMQERSIVSKRFVFGKDAISRLRERVTSCDEWKKSNERRTLSRVVVVSAVLTQAILRVERARNGGKPLSRPTLVAHMIDVRGRTVPPVARHTCGTWVAMAALEMDAEETGRMERDFAGMAVKMRELMVKGVNDCARILSDKKFGRWVLYESSVDAAQKDESKEYKVVWFSDFTKTRDYGLDFGFGKPVWVSFAYIPFNDVCVLMNTKDNDGIEAWVCLHESDMPIFQQDQDLLSLTTGALPETNV